MKCYYVKLLSLYAKRVLYGYKCDLDSLRKDMMDAYVLSRIEENIDPCSIQDNVLDEIRKLKHKLDYNYSNICRYCETT